MVIDRPTQEVRIVAQSHGVCEYVEGGGEAAFLAINFANTY